jgi:primosomal protein N' (replication factor Y) (superfamily II helicase)
VLHRVDHADAVVFLDFDTELLAPRYRAAEQAMAMLVRAARLTGGRSGGRVVVQSRLPHNETLSAFLHGDPGRLTQVEVERRALLQFPPSTALAHVSGPGGAAVFAAAKEISFIEILGTDDAPFLLRAANHRDLADGLAQIPRPSTRVRVVVDPLDI